ncbi:MAG: helix-turn-helix transcriptional regulator [Clostridia bacterium]|nr:helix-turn-helix transcriptional regulator [Clostridia bacterium]
MQFYNLTYGERIMIIRKRVGLTKKELAELCGTTVSVISKMENSMPNPDNKILANIAFVLNVTANMLIFGFDDAKKNQPLEGLIKNA